MRSASLTLLLAAAATAQWAEPGTRSFATLPGTEAGDLFGWWVRAVDDFDRDGLTDFVVAAPFTNNSAGRISAHSGRDGRLLWSHTESTTSLIFGFALIAVQDLDNDNVRDVAAAGPFATNAFVKFFSGRTGALITTLTSGLARDDFGFSLATGGDFDGDGTTDLAVGALLERGTPGLIGRVYVYSLPSLNRIASIDQPRAGEATLGEAVEFVGDANNDMRDELAIAGRIASNNPAGRLYAYTWNGGQPVSIWTLDIGVGGGVDGDHVEGRGDVDGDGCNDLLVGETTYSRARLVSGRTGLVLRTLNGDGPGDAFGWGGIVDDQNDDRIPDLLIGARLSNRVVTRGGRLVLYSGRDGRVLRSWSPTTASTVFGTSAALLGDIDRDGARDLAVGASGLATGPAGQVFLMAGEPGLASWRHYGAGLAGTAGVPAVVPSADPVLGTAPNVEFRSSNPALAPAALVAGLAEAALPLPFGGTLLARPDLVAAVALPPGGLTFSLAIPQDPSLLGIAVFLQGMLLDPGATGAVAVSPGTRLGLGR